MPLLDHFHQPPSVSRAWSSFFINWAVRIADSLNTILPAQRFLAELDVAIGRRLSRS